MLSILEVIESYKKAVNNIDVNICNLQDVTSVYAQKTNALKMSFHVKLSVYESLAQINKSPSEILKQQVIALENKIDALFFRKDEASHYAFIDLSNELTAETDSRIISRLQKQIQICLMQIEIQQINIDICKHEIMDLAANQITPLELASKNIPRDSAEDRCQQLFEQYAQNSKTIFAKESFINSEDYKALGPIDKKLLTQELTLHYALFYIIQFKKYFADAVLKDIQKTENFEKNSALISSAAFAKYIDMCVKYYCNPSDFQHDFILDDDVFNEICQTKSLLKFTKLGDEMRMIDLYAINLAKRSKQDDWANIMVQLRRSVTP